ncbi:UNVERIFIED_ORG: transposase-like protein [Paraburkholderia sediminicola]|nr:transposase-like protein [Paraburkholderia sediminicola]
MKKRNRYHDHRFPAGVISCAVRWYFRFQLSLRDIEELLFERGVMVTYETSRCWCDKFGKGYPTCKSGATKPLLNASSSACWVRTQYRARS